ERDFGKIHVADVVGAEPTDRDPTMVGEFGEVALRILEQFVKKVGTKILGDRSAGPFDDFGIGGKAAGLEFVMGSVLKGVPPLMKSLFRHDRSDSIENTSIALHAD